MIRWLRSLFAWRTIYENDAWCLRRNTVTDERLWTRKFTGGHIPLPMVDGDGQVIPLGAPPSGGSGVSRPCR